MRVTSLPTYFGLRTQVVLHLILLHNLAQVELLEIVQVLLPTIKHPIQTFLYLILLVKMICSIHRYRLRLQHLLVWRACHLSHWKVHIALQLLQTVVNVHFHPASPLAQTVPTIIPNPFILYASLFILLYHIKYVRSVMFANVQNWRSLACLRQFFHLNSALYLMKILKIQLIVQYWLDKIPFF